MIKTYFSLQLHHMNSDGSYDASIRQRKKERRVVVMFGGDSFHVLRGPTSDIQFSFLNGTPASIGGWNLIDFREEEDPAVVMDFFNSLLMSDRSGDLNESTGHGYGKYHY